MEVLAIIPARSGSKKVKNKNIRLINGKPMMAYSIEHALASKLITRVIVSTDSIDYAAIAEQYGAEVPFIRPAEYATDTALDFEVFHHALSFLYEKERYSPDMVVQLRPTYPIRKIEDIDNMIRCLQENKKADSIRCVVPAKEIAYKMWRIDKCGRMSPLLTDIVEAYNMPRQELPTIYYQNACIDVCRTSTIMSKHSMSGEYILSYKMTQNYDIDTEEDFLKATRYLQLMKGGKKFVFDIDGVVAKFKDDLNYENAEPNQEMIDIINQLFDTGNTIVLFTARGYKTGIDWQEITIKQMKKWGVKYNELKFGKPDADYYIDDKNLTMQELLNIFEREE